MFDNLFDSVNEATTQDDIAFLPGGFSPIQKALKVLSNVKKSWKIEIIGDDPKKVNFEDKLSVVVAPVHWQEFSDLVFDGKEFKSGEELDITKLVSESDVDEFAGADFVAGEKVVLKVSAKGWNPYNPVDFSMYQEGDSGEVVKSGMHYTVVKMGKDSKKKMFRSGFLSKLAAVRESEEDKIHDTKKKLKDALFDIISDEPVSSLKLNYDFFRHQFGGRSVRVEGHLMDFSHLVVSARDLFEEILFQHKNDISSLEKVTEAVKNKKNLAMHKPFTNKVVIIGGRLIGTANGITLSFLSECYPSFEFTEKITFDSNTFAPEILDDISTIKSVKVVKNEVFPVGGKFRPAVLSRIYDFIKDYEPEEKK